MTPVSASITSLDFPKAASAPKTNTWHWKNLQHRISSQFTRVKELKPIKFAIQHEINILGRYLFKMGSGVISATKHVFQNLSFDKETAEIISRTGNLGWSEFIRQISFIGIPIDLYIIGDSIKSLCKKRHLDEKIHAGLHIGRSLSSLGYSAAALGRQLVTWGAVAADSLVWVTPVSIASMVLSTAGIGIGVKGFIESHLFSKKLKKIQTTKSTPQDVLNIFQKQRELLETKSNGFLSNHFQIKPKHLKGRLKQIEMTAAERIQSNDAALAAKEANTLKDISDGIKKRIAASRLSNTVRIVAAVVSTIGLCVLLFTPVAPAGYALIAVSGAIMVAKYIYDRIKTRPLAKMLKDPTLHPPAKNKMKAVLSEMSQGFSRHKARTRP